jgi:hypothetical protein
MTRNQRGQFTREEHISTKPMVQLIIITIGQDSAGNLFIQDRSAQPLTPGQCIIPQANSMSTVITGTARCPWGASQASRSNLGLRTGRRASVSVKLGE